VIVADASVLVKWLTREPDTHRAQALLHAPDALHIPDLALFEVPAALTKKAHLGLIAPENVEQLNGLFQLTTEARPIAVHSTLPLMPVAMDLSVRLRHGLYDCVYLALAQALGGVVVTADQKMIRAVERNGLSMLVRSL